MAGCRSALPGQRAGRRKTAASTTWGPRSRPQVFL
jgi:hypothetical protein